MREEPRCLLITGMGHSGTRLITQMFSRHSEVSVPLEILNSVEEYTPLHQFFMRSMYMTPLSAEYYTIDYDELGFIVDAYMEKVDKSKKYFVLKLPYYPLNCLDFFVDYFDENISILNIKRPKNKIINSFVQKGEDKSLYLRNPSEYIQQIKKLSVSARKKFLSVRDAKEFFSELYEHTQELVTSWNEGTRQMIIKDVEIEQFATSKIYMKEILDSLQISDVDIENMMSVVNKNRLLLKFTGKLRKLVPSSIWSFGGQILGKRKI